MKIKTSYILIGAVILFVVYWYFNQSEENMPASTDTNFGLESFGSMAPIGQLNTETSPGKPKRPKTKPIGNITLASPGNNNLPAGSPPPRTAGTINIPRGQKSNRKTRRQK